MPSEIVVPELGESVLEATVSRWLKQEGERVGVGETVVELETDKVNLEVGARVSGVLARIERQESEDVQVGDVLGIIEEVAEGDEAPAPDKEKPAAEREPAPSGKAPREEKAPPEEAQPEEDDQKHRDAPMPREAEPSSERLTPVALRLAREHGIDISQVRAGEPGGRVTRADVESYIQKHDSQQQKPSPERQAARQPDGQPDRQPVQQAEMQPPQTTTPGPEADRRQERIKMSRRRRTIARRLVEAQQTAAMLSTFNEIDMSRVMDLRTRRNPVFTEQHGVKLGFMSFFIKASVAALRAFPQLNAEVQGDEMVLKYYYDIGVAIGDPEGLVVPVLRDADRRSFAEIERQIKLYAQKAQDGALSLEDLRGGTFSITNGGVFGSLLSTPILSPPQVGILGLHKIEKRPVVIDDELEIRPMMYVALSYDHRIVDGREAVQFLVKIKELVEDPESLLLEG
jgi:2-oxoglutarate dehydrogenase E2 component (dihydrolipoamide succinyltransferase)